MAVGLAGGALLQWARRRGWAAEDFTGIAVLALGDGDHRHVANAQFRQYVLRRVELPLPTVDQQQVGPGGIVAIIFVAFVDGDCHLSPLGRG